MNDQSNLPATTEQPRQTRMITPVDDPIPIFSTAKFEHYQRIATVMAAASLIPDALRGDSPQQAIGNCFLVTALADRLGQDPFMLAQCCSVVHGRLMIEGKAVHAGIQHKGHADLKFYYTGERAKGDRRVYVSGKPLTKEEIAALKPGDYPFGCEDMIDGSVDEWKTFEKGGGVKAAWQGQQSEMQLVYRGTRTWARKNRPGIMLGVYTEDEMNDLSDRAEVAAAAPKGRVKQDLRAKLAAPDAPQEGKGGFDKAHATGELPPTVNEDGEVIETVPQETEAAQAAEAKPATSASATDASSSSAAATSGPTASAEPSRVSEPVDDGQTRAISKEDIDKAKREAGLQVEPDRSEWQFKDEIDGAAPEGVAYLLMGDDENEDGLLPTYRNGEPLGRADRKEARGLIVYELHPEPTTIDSTATETAPQADGPPPGAFAAFANAMAVATVWKGGAMTALAALYASDDYKALNPDEQNALLAKAWTMWGARMAAGAEKVDFVTNPTAFSLWMYTQPANHEGADAVIGNFRVLEADPSFAALKDEQKARMKARVEGHAKHLREGA
jgi:hypothetical protein